MQINNTMQTALQGLQNSMREMERGANSVARGVERDQSPGDETTEGLVKVKSSSNTAQANLKVMKTADEVVGQIIDTLA